MSTTYFDGDTFQRGGLTFKVRIEHDHCHAAPWVEYDGHGPVRETRYRNSAGPALVSVGRDSEFLGLVMPLRWDPTQPSSFEWAQRRITAPATGKVAA